MEKKNLSDNKALYIISNLSSFELSKLKHFINSSYFNRSKRIKNLFNVLMAHHPDFDSEVLTKEYLYAIATNNKDYNYSTYRALMHDLLDIIYNFLLIQEIDINSIESNVGLIKILLNRGMYDMIDSEINKCEKTFSKSPRDYNYLQNKYLFESYKYNYLNISKRVVNSGSFDLWKQQFEKSESYLTLLFITEMISDYINAKVLADKYNSVGIEFPGKILSTIDVERLIEHISQQDLKIVNMMYLSLYKMFNTFGNIDAYNEYKTLIFKNEGEQSSEEINMHFDQLINYCIISNKNNSNDFFRNQLFELYEYYLMNEYYKTGSITNLQVSTFRNILTNAIRFKKYEWAENFIKLYSNKLEESKVDNMYNYGMAMLFNELGKNSESLHFIEKIKPENFVFKYDLYSLKAKIWYEFNDPIPLTEHLYAFKQYVKKDPLMNPLNKRFYKKFIKYVNILVEFKENKGNHDLDIIREQIYNISFIAYKHWLLDQVAYLQKSEVAKPGNIYSFN